MIGDNFKAGQMLLVRLKALMTTVLGCITVENHFILAGSGLKTVVGIGLNRMEVKRKQKPGAFENEYLVFGMLI